MSSSKIFIDPLVGNVGIGTANPQAKLDVFGNVGLKGTIQHLDLFVANSPSERWFKIGTYTCTTNGSVCTITICGGSGYDHTSVLIADKNFTCIIELQAGNGFHQNIGGYYYNIGLGGGNCVVNGVYVVTSQTIATATSWDVYCLFASYIGSPSLHVKTDATSKFDIKPSVYLTTPTWTTPASSTAVALPASWGVRPKAGALGINLIENGNVGIGTTRPQQNLVVGTQGAAVSVAIISGGDNAANTATLFFGTPFLNTPDSGLKSAIIAETIGYSRCKLHFCLDNTALNGNIYNASLTNARMTIQPDGNVGIGTTIPLKRLHVVSTDLNSGIAVSDSGANSATASTQLNSYPNNTTFMPCSAATNVFIYYKDGSGVKRQVIVAANATLFTGQHLNYAININSQLHEGLIIVSNGTYKSFINNAQESNYMFINECLPNISLSQYKKQKSVFGVVTSAPNQVIKRDDGKIIYDYEDYDFERDLDGRIRVNSVGEGGLWVCNDNGNLENGDYITTSDVPGYGMKQDETMMMNFTVAKITCDCNFDELPSWIRSREIDHNNVTYKCAFVGCTYHCG